MPQATPGNQGKGEAWMHVDDEEGSAPLHFQLPEDPENPIDLQITDAAPALRPLLQMGTQAPSTKISGRPAPSIDGDPSSESKRTAPSDAPTPSDPAQYTTVSDAWPMHDASGADHVHSSTLHSKPEHRKSAMALHERAI